MCMWIGDAFIHEVKISRCDKIIRLGQRSRTKELEKEEEKFKLVEFCGSAIEMEVFFLWIMAIEIKVF